MENQLTCIEIIAENLILNSLPNYKFFFGDDKGFVNFFKLIYKKKIILNKKLSLEQYLNNYFNNENEEINNVENSFYKLFKITQFQINNSPVISLQSNNSNKLLTRTKETPNLLILWENESTNFKFNIQDQFILPHKNSIFKLSQINNGNNILFITNKQKIEIYIPNRKYNSISSNIILKKTNNFNNGNSSQLNLEKFRSTPFKPKIVKLNQIMKSDQSIDNGNNINDNLNNNNNNNNNNNKWVCLLKLNLPNSKNKSNFSSICILQNGSILIGNNNYLNCFSKWLTENNSLIIKEHQNNNNSNNNNKQLVERIPIRMKPIFFNNIFQITNKKPSQERQQYFNFSNEFRTYYQEIDRFIKPLKYYHPLSIYNDLINLNFKRIEIKLIKLFNYFYKNFPLLLTKKLKKKKILSYIPTINCEELLNYKKQTIQKKLTTAEINQLIFIIKNNIILPDINRKNEKIQLISSIKTWHECKESQINLDKFGQTFIISFKYLKNLKLEKELEKKANKKKQNENEKEKEQKQRNRMNKGNGNGKGKRNRNGNEKKKGSSVQINLTSIDYNLALHCDDQESLILKCYDNPIDYTWENLSKLGIAYWINDKQFLMKLIDKIASAQYKIKQDPEDAALFYLILGKKVVLKKLYKFSNNPRVENFLDNNFNTKKWKSAAQKNAYALLSKKRFLLSAAFFVLANQIEDAINIIIKKIGDYQLAFLLVRILMIKNNNNNLQIYDKVLNSIFEISKKEKNIWLTSLIHWLKKDYKKSIKCLLIKDDDDDDNNNNNNNNKNFFNSLNLYNFFKNLIKFDKNIQDINFSNKFYFKILFKQFQFYSNQGLTIFSIEKLLIINKYIKKFQSKIHIDKINSGEGNRKKVDEKEKVDEHQKEKEKEKKKEKEKENEKEKEKENENEFDINFSSYGYNFDNNFDNNFESNFDNFNNDLYNNSFNQFEINENEDWFNQLEKEQEGKINNDTNENENIINNKELELKMEKELNELKILKKKIISLYYEKILQILTIYLDNINNKKKFSILTNFKKIKSMNKKFEENEDETDKEKEKPSKTLEMEETEEIEEIEDVEEILSTIDDDEFEDELEVDDKKKSRDIDMLNIKLRSNIILILRSCFFFISLIKKDYKLTKSIFELPMNFLNRHFKPFPLELLKTLFRYSDYQVNLNFNELKNKDNQNNQKKNKNDNKNDLFEEYDEYELTLRKKFGINEFNDEEINKITDDNETKKRNEKDKDKDVKELQIIDWREKLKIEKMEKRKEKELKEKEEEEKEKEKEINLFPYQFSETFCKNITQVFNNYTFHLGKKIFIYFLLLKFTMTINSTYTFNNEILNPVAFVFNTTKKSNNNNNDKKLNQLKMTKKLLEILQLQINQQKNEILIYLIKNQLRFPFKKHLINLKYNENDTDELWYKVTDKKNEFIEIINNLKKIAYQYYPIEESITYNRIFFKKKEILAVENRSIRSICLNNDNIENTKMEMERAQNQEKGKEKEKEREEDNLYFITKKELKNISIKMNSNKSFKENIKILKFDSNTFNNSITYSNTFTNIDTLQRTKHLTKQSHTTKTKRFKIRNKSKALSSQPNVLIKTKSFNTQHLKKNNSMKLLEKSTKNETSLKLLKNDDNTNLNDNNSTIETIINFENEKLDDEEKNKLKNIQLFKNNNYFQPMNVNKKNKGFTYLESHPVLPLFLIGDLEGNISIRNFGENSSYFTYPTTNNKKKITKIHFNYNGKMFGAITNQPKLLLYKFGFEEKNASSNFNQPIAWFAFYFKKIIDFTFLNTPSKMAIIGTTNLKNQKNIIIADFLLPYSKNIIHAFNLANNEIPVLIMYSRKNGMIIIGGKNGSIFLYHLTKRKIIANIRAHSLSITSMDLHPSEKYFVSASRDGSIAIFSLPEMKLEIKFHNAHQKVRLLLKNDGRTIRKAAWVNKVIMTKNYLISCGADGKLILRNQKFKYNFKSNQK
ncbi:rabconnectin-3a [Anaeramoeba flamelloides]|uniref:Rabconnectin-3a n=1 Tax=Anaeramoeba flamelloides TaxID=1746091 RepID=A0AAV7YE26_9EUKA|nr:rabconnectin-3a [Anaeramoeba flamelloides]